MASAKRIRLFEGTLVLLFLFHAFRAFFGQILSTYGRVVEGTSSPILLVATQCVLLVGLVLLTLIPRRSESLPALLSLFALISAIFRFLMTLGDPVLTIVASIFVIISGAGYTITLLRLNRYSWSTALILAIAVDLLLRAYDTYDITMRPWFEITVSNLLYRVPMFIVQLILSIILIVASRALLKNSSLEEHSPGVLHPWSGLALGGFLSLQFIVLFLPNVIARWTAMPYESIAPWLALSITLPLIPEVRSAFGVMLSHVESSLKGWIIFFFFVVFLIMGYRLTGLVASSALILTEFLAIMLVWWIPGSHEEGTRDQNAASTTLGLLVFILSVYLYALTFDENRVFLLLNGQALALVILDSILISLPLIVSPDSNPWVRKFDTFNKGVAVTIMILVVGTTYFLSMPGGQEESRENQLRVATYNINYGFDEAGNFQFATTALTIKASEADIIALQEVDTGHPMSFGMDQVQYLAKHLNMNPVFQPDTNKLRGLAILSHYPISNSRGESLNTVGESALMLAVDVQAPDNASPFQLLSGDLISSSQNERLAQFALLLDLIDPQMPAILAADFAGSTNDVVYQQFVQSGFIDPDTILGIEMNFTYPASAPTIRQDMVLVRGFSPLSSYQVDSTASDHRLVLIEASLE